MKLCQFSCAALLALAAVASADVGPNGEGLIKPDADGVPESEFSPLLSNDYRDEPNLLRFAPPAGVRLIQRAGGAGGLEIVTFVHDAKQWGGNVQVVQIQAASPDLTVEEFLRQSARDLSKTFKGVQIVESKEITVSGRKAGRQTTVMEAESVREGAPAAARGGAVEKQRTTLVHHMLVVRLEPRKYMVLNFYAPSASQADAAKAFDAMVGRFQILDPRVVDQRRKEASAAGRNWLKDVKAEMLASKLSEKPQYFRMKVDGRDVGFVCFTEAEVVRDGYTGVVINAASRSFPGDGSMITSKAEAFWAYRDDAYKGQPTNPKKPHPTDAVFYSCWASGTENLYKMNTPEKPNEVRAGKTWANEMGAMALSTTAVAEGKEPLTDERGNPVKDKQGNVLYKTRLGAATPENTTVVITAVRTSDSRVNAVVGNSAANDGHKTTSWPIEPKMPAPLPKALEYSWARVVDLNKPASYAFTVFNMQTRKLGLRTLTVHGKQSITIDGKTVLAVRLTDELDPGSTTLWVDSNGRTLMMRTSDGTTLTPTTEAEMLTAWQSTINAMNALPAPDPNQIIIDANKPRELPTPRR